MKFSWGGMSPDPPSVVCSHFASPDTGTLTNCTEAMTWPDHLKTACSGSTVHYVPPPAFGLWYTKSSSHTT